MSEPFYNLFNALMDLLLRNNAALLICNLHTVAMVKVNGTFVLFDSHSRSSEGVTDQNGKAIALFYENANFLYQGVLRLIRSTGASYATPFELIPLSVQKQNAMNNGQIPTKSDV